LMNRVWFRERPASGLVLAQLRKLFFIAPSRAPGTPHPRFPVEFRGFPELYAALLNESRTRGPVRG
jgi:hypothetical protein